MSDQPILVFVHGWGFDAGFWSPLRERLTDAQSFMVDLGFRGGEFDMPTLPDGNIIAIGHSLGFLWLIKNKPFSWQKLVSINGFARFLAADDFPSGLDARILSAMIEQCRKNPDKVVADFFTSCGHQEAIKQLNPETLVQGLEWLRDWDGREELAAEKAPLLSLAGKNDPITPKGLTEASFSEQKSARLEWHDGGHLLPLSTPSWCAIHIRDFMAAS